LPEFAASHGPDGSITVKSKTKPQEVLLWQAHNDEARDFRLETLGPVWKSKVSLATMEHSPRPFPSPKRLDRLHDGNDLRHRSSLTLEADHERQSDPGHFAPSPSRANKAKRFFSK